MRMAGKTAIVTGGGSGIGKAIAAAFAREGAQVVICGREARKLEQAVTEIDPQCLAVAADVSHTDDINSLVGQTVRKFKQLDILVNNAGILLPGTAESLTNDQWERTYNTNVRAVWQLSRAALPHMRKAGKGSIINIASVLSSLGARNRVAYAASKGAVLAMSRAMALDHAEENIRINCICPGIVETEMVATFNLDEKARQQRIAAHPMGRFGQPEDIAGLAVFLATDEASWITGAAFPADGGYSAH
jgi:meso-butanediol dehydrogenase / (S,S)-butanediol dehydrogenase / diacetyl reductase